MLCVAGEAVGTEEQAAVTITGVSQAAFPDHNVQYQFRTENNGGQVSTENLFSSYNGPLISDTVRFWKPESLNPQASWENT